MSQTKILNALRNGFSLLNASPDPAFASGTAVSVLGRLGRALLFVNLFLSPLIFRTKTLEFFQYPKVIALIATAIVLLFGGVARLARPISFNPGAGTLLNKLLPVLKEPISLGILLFFFSAFCSTVFSIHWQTSFYGEFDSFSGLITVASYTILFFGTRVLCRGVNDFRMLFVATVFGVAGTVLYGVIQISGLGPLPLDGATSFAGIDRVYSTMGHANHLSGFLVMSFPMICFFRTLALKKNSWGIGTLLMVVELFGAILVVFSFSRGAWIAMVFMLFVLAIGLASVTKSRKVVLSALIPWTIGLALGVLYFSVVPFAKEGLAGEGKPHGEINPSIASPANPELPNPLGLRLQQMRLSALTEGTRWPIWTAAFAMFLDHPLFGVGLDGFQLAFGQYRPVHYWLREWGGTPATAHNEFLNVLATQGGLGAVATLIITVGLGTAFVRVLRRNGSDRMLLIAVLAGGVGFYVQSLFSFIVPGVGTLIITFAAMLSRLGECSDPNTDSERTDPEEVAPPEEVGPPAGIVMPIGSGIPTGDVVPATRRGRTSPVLASFRIGIQGIIWILAGLTIYNLVYLPYRANTLFLSGRAVLVRDPTLATTRILEAIDLDPTKDIYFLFLGVAYRKAAYQTTDTLVRRKRFMLSREAHEEAIRLVPIDSYNWFNLAEVLNKMAGESPPLAKKEEVYHAIERAIEQDPNNPDFYVMGANMALSFRDSATALRWAKTAATLYPNFALPHAQLGTIALLDSVLFLASNRPVDVKRRSEAAMGHLEQALHLFGETDPMSKRNVRRALADAHFYHAQAEERLGAFDNARAAYRRLFEIQPSHPEGTKAFLAFQKRMGGTAVSGQSQPAGVVTPVESPVK